MTLDLARDSFRALPRPRLLWLAEFVGNPALVAFFLLWLLIPEATAGQLLLSLVLAAVLAGAFLVLLGATLAWFHEHHRGGGPTLRGAFRTAARHLGAVLVWSVPVFLLWCLLESLYDYRYQLPAYITSLLPATVRGWLGQDTLVTAYSAVIAILFWVIVPGLLLPLGVQAAAHGFRGFGGDGLRAWGRALRRAAYWLVLLLAAVVGVWAPGVLLGWTPKPGGALSVEMASLVGRMFLAYLLALFAWMLVASAAARAGVQRDAAA